MRQHETRVIILFWYLIYNTIVIKKTFGKHFKMMEEMFNLTWPPWHTYTDHLKEMLHQIKLDDTFTDVTLVSDDGRKLRAHKVVLGACSPILKIMLANDADGTDLIDLKGIAFEEIEAILQFIYLGEATIHKDRMSEFLNVVQKLKVKELFKDSDVDNHEQKTETEVGENLQLTMNNQDYEYYNIMKYDDNNKETLVIDSCQQAEGRGEDELTTGDFYIEYRDSRTRELLQESEKMAIRLPKAGVKVYQCPKCDYKTWRKDQMKGHIKRRHVNKMRERNKNVCKYCQKIFSTKSNLARHESQKKSCNELRNLLSNDE